jgi:hypothetical protein
LFSCELIFFICFNRFYSCVVIKHCSLETMINIK